jgi:hypothetical protein
MSFSQSRGNRVAWFFTASLFKCSISSATLITVYSVVQHIAVRCVCPWNGWCVDPFALCPAFLDALGGRNATDYYGSAAPRGALATCLPIPYGKRHEVPALLAQHVLRQL